jgi:methylmalonyl-CoA/ethylmalonyl-CoA epimerase
MVLENIEEIALAVVNQEEAVALFEELFGIEFKDTWTVPVDSMRVRCAKIGDTQFHLLASEKPDAVIAKYIQNRGEGRHHIAFRVSNLKQLIVRLRGKGVRLVPDEPREDELRRYIFVHPKSMHGLLLELIEYKRS